LLLLLRAGAHHAVDSSELAFRLAAIGAVRQGKGIKTPWSHHCNF